MRMAWLLILGLYGCPITLSAQYVAQHQSDFEAWKQNMQTYRLEEQSLELTFSQVALQPLDHCDRCVLRWQTNHWGQIMPLPKHQNACQLPAFTVKRKWWQRRKKTPHTGMYIPTTLRQIGDRYLIYTTQNGHTGTPQYITRYYECSGLWDTTQVGMYLNTRSKIDEIEGSMTYAEVLERFTQPRPQWLHTLDSLRSYAQERAEYRLPLRTRWALRHVEVNYYQAIGGGLHEERFQLQMTPTTDFKVFAQGLYADFEIDTDSISIQGASPQSIISNLRHTTQGYVPILLDNYLILEAYSHYPNGNQTSWNNRITYYFEYVEEGED